MNRKLVSVALAIGVISLFATAMVAESPSAAPARFPLPETDAGLPGDGPIRRGEWFQNNWTKFRTKWVEQVEREQNAVVLLGDSITEGWGEDFSRHFPGLKVANRGIGGDTSRGVLIRLEDVFALHPRAVVLLIGTNDIADRAEPETIAGNVKLILAALRRHNADMPIVLCQVMPSSEKQNRPADKIRKLNELYADVAQGDPRVTLLETWPLFADAQGEAPLSEFPDLLHLNQAAYAKWAAALRPIFATLGLIETEPFEFTPETGFVALFNGRDLTGWVTELTGAAANAGAGDMQARPASATATADGRFVAKNGRLIATTPSGSSVGQLWLNRNISGDFTLRLEFRATPNADGRIRIGDAAISCGDYALTSPHKPLREYRRQDWNELTISVHDGVAQCLCNGQVIEPALRVSASRLVGFEAARGQIELRRLRLKTGS